MLNSWESCQINGEIISPNWFQVVRYWFMKFHILYVVYIDKSYDSNGQTSSMICQRLDTYNGPQVLYLIWIIIFELYLLCLEVHSIRYELRLIMTKAFPLLKLIMTSTGWGAISIIFKVFFYDIDINLHSKLISSLDKCIMIY